MPAKSTVVRLKKKVAGKDEHYRKHPTAGKIVAKNPNKSPPKKRAPKPLSAEARRYIDYHESLARYHTRTAGMIPEQRESHQRQAADHAAMAEHYRKNPPKERKKRPGMFKRLVGRIKKLWKGRKSKTKKATKSK